MDVRGAAKVLVVGVLAMAGIYVAVVVAVWLVLAALSRLMGPPGFD